MIKEVFEKQVEKEVYKNPSKLDLNLFKKRGKSKGFSGYLLSRMKEVFKRDPLTTYTNLELCYVLQEIYKKYVYFDELRSSAKIRLAKWKGKSGIKLIVKPNIFIVIRYQKKDKDSAPIEVVRRVSKKDVNLVIHSLNLLSTSPNFKEKVKTKDIAREYCILANLKENHNKRPFFDVNGFIWENFFGDRYLHPLLVDILDILDYYGIIKYRAGYSQILKKITDIQTILK